MTRMCANTDCQEGPGYGPAPAYDQDPVRWARFEAGQGHMPYDGLCLNCLAQHNLEAGASGGEVAPIGP